MKINEWHWEITRRCNLRCIHCLLGDSEGARELSNAQSKIAVARMAELGAKALKITGGEPTIRPDLSELVEMADQAGVRVELITNGYAMGRKLCSQLRDKLYVLAVSIDGLPGIHDRIRGHGSFSRAMATIATFSSSRTIISASITVNALNFFSMGELVDLLLESGVTHFHLSDVVLEGRAINHQRMLRLRDTPAEIEAQLLEDLGKRFGLKEKEIVIDESCNIDPSVVYVAADGKIFPCVETAFRKPNLELGQILDESLGDSIDRRFSQCRRPAVCRYKSITGPGVGIVIDQRRACDLALGGVQ